MDSIALFCDINQFLFLKDRRLLLTAMRGFGRLEFTHQRTEKGRRGLKPRLP